MTKRTRAVATAERIRHKMIERGMNNQTLGIAAGVRPSVISRIFSEGRDLKGTTLAGIAKALHCTSDELLGINQRMSTDDLDKARAMVSKLDDLLWSMNG